MLEFQIGLHIDLFRHLPDQNPDPVVDMIQPRTPLPDRHSPTAPTLL